MPKRGARHQLAAPRGRAGGPRQEAAWVRGPKVAGEQPRVPRLQAVELALHPGGEGLFRVLRVLLAVRAAAPARLPAARVVAPERERVRLPAVGGPGLVLERMAEPQPERTKATPRW